MAYRNSNKRVRDYVIRVFVTLVAFLAITNQTNVYAEAEAEGVGHKDELVGCIFSLDQKRITFAAYQPSVDNKRLCRKLSEATGTTYFSLDLVDKPLRERVLQIKVTPIMKVDDEFKSNSPVVSFEVSSSPSGVVDFEHDFQGVDGWYRLDVINEQDHTQGSFEFEVGVKEFRWEGKFGQRVAFGFFGFLVLLSLGYLAMRKKKK